MYKKTIAIFSGFYLPFLGGIERYTDKLSSQLISKGYKVVIVTTNHDNLSNIEKQDNKVIYRLPSKKWVKQRYPIIDKNKEYHDLMKKIESENIDYVVCNTRFQLTTLIGLKFAHKNHIPNLVIEHGSSHFTVNNKILDFFGLIYEHMLTWRIKKYADQFYAVSKRSGEWLKHFNIEYSGTLYNSVDEDLDELVTINTEKKSLIISYAGRILREKGVEMLLDAFSEIDHSTAKLVIAGDGPILNELEKKYNNKQIVFTGKLDFLETMQLLKKTDIFVYPSMYPEGLPTSILEAGMLNCAVIATDRGGTREVISSSKYGIIIDEDKTSLKEALEVLIKNPLKRQEMQENIHKKISSEFTWEATTNKLMNIIEQ